MKLIIKNPAPLGPNQQKWGDYHFGRCLGKYLQRLGVEVETHYRPDWGQPDHADAVLVLRGKYQYRPTPGPFNVMWCMSNPSTVTARECNSYDAVCVASVTHAAQLAGQVTAPVHALLQCTDLEEFESGAEVELRKGFIFVGNSRGVRRPCADWAIAFGLDLAIYGRGWRDWNLEGRVVSDYVANEELPELYASSRLSLNDHWQDMKALGYVNNRVFDCLAAGLPVLSDDFPELRQICGEALLYYDDQKSFDRAVTEASIDYQSVHARQQALWRGVRKNFSFEQRAAFLHELLGKNRQFAPKPRAAVPERTSASLHSGRWDQVEARYRENPGCNYCPVCGTNTESFVARGATKKRARAACPECGALERHRLFWIYFVNTLWPMLPRGLKQLLHVAPEEQMARVLHEQPDINYLSGDLNMAHAMVKLDLTSLAFPDKRFDLIVCSHVLEHVPDDRKAMSELFRVTRPGGYTLLMVPMQGSTTYEDPSITSPEDRRWIFGQSDHVRIYGMDITERLSGAGFKVTVRQPALDLDPGLAAFLGLIKGQTLFECHRMS